MDKIIDIHVHLGGKGDLFPEHLYWSESFEHGLGFASLKILKGWSFKKVGDKLMLKTVTKQVKKADKIDRAVLLALDNVYDADGTYRGPGPANPGEVKTNLFVSNEFVCNPPVPFPPKVLRGISVHPLRPDALDELDRYQDKAVLCKWLPSAQLIPLNSSDDDIKNKLKAFYAKLAAVNLPLLLHAGKESSIPTWDKKYDQCNNPIFIQPALEMGVTVIMTHCGCSYFDSIEENFLTEALELLKVQRTVHQEWKLYADISALFSPFRDRKTLDRIFGEVPAGQLIYGSDFPNPAKMPGECLLRPFLRYKKTNLLNRYYSITDKYFDTLPNGIQLKSVFTNFHGLLVSLGRGSLVA